MTRVVGRLGLLQLFIHHRDWLAPLDMVNGISGLASIPRRHHDGEVIIVNFAGFLDVGVEHMEALTKDGVHDMKASQPSYKKIRNDLKTRTLDSMFPVLQSSSKSQSLQPNVESGKKEKAPAISETATAAMFVIIKHLVPWDQVEQGYNVELIHHSSNMLLLRLDLYAEFDRLDICLEEIEVRRGERLLAWDYKEGLAYPKLDQRISFADCKHGVPAPRKEMLRLHTACATVAHLSGADERWVKEYRDPGDDDHLEGLPEYGVAAEAVGTRHAHGPETLDEMLRMAYY
ncbi:hypothetical protein DACRYDRAFT_107451 [Dacryopinax primogenitus]|uniref:HNH nuclease domain-containing protein n=1 Tax=Dacryopinax primogenitus (strain DJM 731) TaxID=1858805 RepID=M5GCE4_DACPD|nr:uncharacterized protein DACRYDRAFT_107451 [Dacryopinax primogenitus]EJU01708.1 hypothetical protein DACRYDRAFT_107451 [Dacryopinax primogenitus]